MSGISKILFALAILSSPTFADDYPRGEGYDGRNSGIDTRIDYSNLLAQNRKNNPQRAGESDGDYAVRMALLTQSQAPTSPNDTNVIDRSEKLGDAAQIALEGKKASAAQMADLFIRSFNMRMDTSGGAAGAAANGAEADKMDKRAAKYGEQSTADDIAYVNNQQGKVRLLADAPDKDGGPPPSKAFVASVAAGLSDESKDALKKRGVDPQEAVERLLSGEVNLKDPSAVMKALGEMSNLSPSELAKVMPLGGYPDGDEQLTAANLRTGFDPEGKEARGTVVVGDKGKEKDFDNSEFNKKTGWLGGIPISIMNREVMGHRIGDWFGFNNKKKGKAGAQGPDATAALKLKAPGAKARKGVATAKNPTPVERYRLQDKGVTTLRKGSTIFQVAHRQYRDFNKWREKKVRRGRVAQN